MFRVSATAASILPRGAQRIALTYITQVFTDFVNQYNPKGTDTNIFYFDGAANVQKAGRILEARFPCTTVLYDEEHALAL